MKTKEQNYNAGLIKSVFRSLVGGGFLLSFYFLWFWASFDLTAAILGTLGLMILGPSFVFALLLVIRFLGSRRYRWKRQDPLAEIYLSNILHSPGPRLRVWVESNRVDPNILWFENPFSKSSRQELFVSEAWMKLEEARKAESFHGIWQEIRKDSRSIRLLRSLQLSVWVGWMWPLELLFQVLKIFQDFIGMRDLPYLSFWVQRLCNSFLQIWVFRNEQSPEAIFLKQNASLEKAPSFPVIWNSLLWGPWYKYCSERIHPLWNFWGFQVSNEKYGKFP